MVTWLDPQSTEAEIYKENMGVLKIEYVANNHKANWPNTAEYSIPTKEGYLFVGWDFDWETTPIIQDTDIHAIWMKGDPQPTECISAVDNSGIDHPIDGDDDLGLDADGDWVSDSIRSAYATTNAEALDDWITIEKFPFSQDIIDTYGFTGWFKYTVAKNTGSRRIGRVKITTPGTEIADPDKWAEYGADGVKTFCAETITYIVQKGAEDVDPELTDFEKAVAAFSSYVTIPEDGTTYNYLEELYNEAYSQFYSNHSAKTDHTYMGRGRLKQA